MRSGGAFSDEEIQLLRGLPAVSNVTRDRITYSDTFRQVCTIRYLAGESPTKIFREAGLPPELVGYKRIERSVARWKDAAIKSVSGSDTMTDGEIIAQLAARYKRALATRRSLEDIANTATEPKPAATAASNDVHPLSLGLFDGDTAGIIIRQQARRIDELERDVVRLRNKLDKEVGPNDLCYLAYRWRMVRLICQFRGTKHAPELSIPVQHSPSISQTGPGVGPIRRSKPRDCRSPALCRAVWGRIRCRHRRRTDGLCPLP